MATPSIIAGVPLFDLLEGIGSDCLPVLEVSVSRIDGPLAFGAPLVLHAYGGAKPHLKELKYLKWFVLGKESLYGSTYCPPWGRWETPRQECFALQGSAMAHTNVRGNMSIPKSHHIWKTALVYAMTTHSVFSTLMRNPMTIVCSTGTVTQGRIVILALLAQKIALLDTTVSQIKCV